MSPIPSLLFVLLAVAASAPSCRPPFGANATFGSVAVFDDELRTGLSRDSPLVARYQGIIAATGVAAGPASQGHLTVASILFVAGEYNGSALSIEGPFVGFLGTMERSIVGGNGKFRMARGYYQLTLLNLTSPISAVSEANFYVLTCDPSYL
ncbi:unnamed protein product [Alopecurus aequalis]